MTFPPKLKNACFVVSLMSIGLLQIATNTNQMQSLIGYALTPPIVLLVGIVLLKKLDVVRRACAIVSENKRIGHVSFLWAVMTAVAFIGNFWLFLSVKVYPSLSALLRCGGTVAVILVGVASVYALYVIYVFLMKFVFDRLPAFLRGICVCEAAAGVFAWVVLFAAAAYYLFAYNVQANLFFYDTDTLWQLRNWYSDSFNSISNAYTYICHQANLLKESTFGIFSMPIMVPFALLAFAVEAVSCKDIFPLLACFANIGLIVFSALNFSRAFGLGRVSSTCFILLYCFSFSAIMNAIFPEQYVMSIFFVSLTVLAIVRKDPARTPLYMASTTMLLSSGILIFFAGAGNTFKKWIGSLLKWGLIFVALILIFGQLHTVVKFLAADALVGRFASRDSNNVVQFSDSLSGIFVQPNTLYSLDSPTLSDSGNYAAYISNCTEYNFVFLGGFIFLLALLSLYANRRLLIAKVSATWVFASVFIVVIVGWGCAEKSATLYSYYFQWAYLGLMVLLLEKLVKNTRVRIVIMIALLLAMLGSNVRSWRDYTVFIRENVPQSERYRPLMPTCEQAPTTNSASSCSATLRL